jgi:hypothetical protein
MTLSNREKMLLLGCVVVLIAAAYIWFFFLPLSGEIASLTEQNQSLQADIERLQAVPALAEPDPAAAQQALEEMEASFPLKPDQVEVLDILNQAADKTHLLLKSVNNSEKSNSSAGKTGKMSFDVTTRGGFHDSMEFLSRLEEDGRISSVDNIVLNTVKKKDQPAAAQATVSESSSESAPPVYFLQPLLAPVAKSEALQQPGEKTPGPVVETVTRQAANLEVGQVEMKMQVIFYYFDNEKKAEADKNKPSGAVNT